MSRFAWKRYLSVLTVLLAGSCIDRYTPPDIDAKTTYLVVDGFLNGGLTISTIKLSRTRNLTDTKKPTVELKAQVRVESERNNSYLLADKGDGSYTLSGTELRFGDKYRLRIKTAAGREYLSDFVTVMKTPPIDSLTWKAGSEGLEIQMNTHDSENKTKYYRWEYEETWEYFTPYYSQLEYKNGQFLTRQARIDQCWGSEKSTNVLVGTSARLSQDVISRQLLTIVPTNVNKLRVKYSILVKQYALSKDAYEFWLNLKKNSESLGSLFDPQPSQVVGNVYSVNNPGEAVMGFVSGYSVEEKRLFVTPNQIPYRGIPSGYESCEPDTVLPKDVQFYFQGGGYIPITTILNEMGQVIGYQTDGSVCVDCRQRGGTTTRPSFWN